jgi:KaiC/GvpD/RAD55 family RecA-like ATPase
VPKSPPVFLGFPTLDERAAEALPRGWLGLLIGHGDAETSLFAKQFTQAVPEGASCVYYTTYETTEEVKAMLAEKGWASEELRIVNLSEEYYHQVLVRRLEVSQARERGLKLAHVKDSGRPSEPRRPYDLANRVLSDIAQIDRPVRLVLDSLDFLIEVLDIAEVMTVSRQIRHRVQQLGGQALLVLHDEIHDRRATGLLEDLADVVLELATLPSQGSFEHRLTIRKVRNHPEMKRTAVLRVTRAGFALEADHAE